MDKIKHLEKLAVEAHKAGQGWYAFTQQHAEAIRLVEPVNLMRYRRLRSKLLHLLTTGDESGQFPPGDADAIPEWEADDQPVVDDVATAARFNAAAAGLPLTQGMMFDQAEATP